MGSQQFIVSFNVDWIRSTRRHQLLALLSVVRLQNLQTEIEQTNSDTFQVEKELHIIQTFQ